MQWWVARKARAHQSWPPIAPDPAGGAYSAPPDSLAEFGGRFAAGAGDEEGKGKGREGKWRGSEREGPQVTVEPGPLRALLRHCA